MSLKCHEPRPTATHKHSCLQIGKFREMERSVTQVVLLCRSSEVCGIVCTPTSLDSVAMALTFDRINIVAIG